MARKTNVLLVDDDHSVREALGRALRDENFQVVAAASGPEALSQVECNHIDVALLDLNLGQENGWDTFQRLNGLQPLLPVIVMSARPDSFVHAFAAAAAALMEKPLNMPILVKTLQDLSSAAPRRKPGSEDHKLNVGAKQEAE